ncbi:hypothetical protein RB195_003687 [Necator americanus]|uniref:Amino acid transporter transmembrane domain-containing protein n=1 Tax=Necator americanus TaxID=51031 RepID=A0ABR1DPX5_NECAM
MAESAFEHSQYEIFVRHKRKARYFVNFCLIAFQVGVASVAYVFVVDHLQEIFLYFKLNVGLSTKELLLVYTIPAILINFVRTIRTVTVICLIGNVFIFASIGLILGELFTSEHNWKSLPWITSFDGVVASAGSLLYSFEGQAMVLPLENKLKHPEDMLGLTGVLTTGMSLVTIIYTYCGFFGYITYGENVQGSITLNLPDSGLNVAVKILLVLVVFFGNVLQMYVIIEMLWPPLRNKLELKKKSNTTILILEYLFRAGVVCFAMLWAIAIPNLQEIIPFVESHPGAGIIAPGSAGIAGRPGIPGIPPGGSTPNGVRHQTRVIDIPICAIGRLLVLQLPSALHVSAAVIPPSTGATKAAIRARNPGKGITDPAATACTKPALHIKQAEEFQ